ncbi:MAG: hypothetical protein VX278_15705 [Myxococcota bacterium]|nr:hypothetical protein [Myxococcota bacterium]
MMFPLVAFWLGCQERSPEESGYTETLIENAECENTFSPHTLAYEAITEYGVDVPKREDAIPLLLSETGLYEDIVNKEIHPAVRAFKPQYELWSDDADKQRWVYVPECEKIDTSNINDWQFPVGTRFFKEFSVNGRRIETRLIERIGEGPRDFAQASYMWNEDETEAERVGEEGVANAKGTNHDIPSKSQCLQCHGTYSQGGGRPSRGLGFSAMQLSHSDEGWTLDQLIEEDRLSHPPASSFEIPGDETTKAALGYLHANCGSCHNPSKDGLPQFDLNLWLDVGLSSPEESGAWQTAVDTDTQIFKDQHVDGRIIPGDPARSALLYRMLQRGNRAQMPPVASKIIDENGAAILSEWIESLP